MIGSRIRDLRLEKHMSQGELAKLVEVPQPTLSDIEHNRYEPRAGDISKYAQVLNVTVDMLLNEEVKN
ncbi:helix-turn-helix transcriptional regulator [Lacticaseibacillus paracasei]|uniref:helix-turn-helix transcriptional regulator n=1 Tax=Lacticaseibacillus paracasei TaxID=1597 RepID=UPI0021589E10|nr:helix-turn-helix transcriptional regulator [Lacticaseibacillus paracasei]UVD36052.1 helix-turn-helix domain-containing protein [Lacticaseibacillus paracasei]